MKKKKRAAKKIARKRKSKPVVKVRHVCERYREDEMCYKCLDLTRSLLLCGDLNGAELTKIRKIMTDIINKKGVLKEDVVFLNQLSDEYLN